MRQTSLVLATVVLMTAGLAGASERVVVESDDGFELVATLWQNDEKAPGLLLLHQCDGDRSMFHGLGATLAAAGFRVLAPDLRGLGESKSADYDLETAGEEADWEQARERFGSDVEAAYRYLGEVVGVLGASCGGGEAIRLATAHPEITGVALLSARLSSVEERDAMKLPSQQLLLIAAKSDLGAARPAGTLGYRKRSASTLKLFEGSAHGSALLAEHPALEGDIVAWFEEVLAGPGQP